MTEQFKFHYGNDEFVNEAVAELARRLSKGNLDVTVEKCEITIEGDSPIESLETVIEGELASNTHRRSSIARYYQSNSVETDIKPVSEPFPDKHDNIGESIDEADLERIGIDDPSIEISANIGQSIYTLSPSYTGHPIRWKTTRLSKYMNILKNEYNKDYNASNRCRCCSRDDLPTWLYDGEQIDYNQQFTHYTTKSGQRALGQRSAQSVSKRGRCIACLIAGFSYTLISKPFYTTEDIDYRIFTIKGPFDALYSVRQDYKNNVLTDIDAEVNSEDPRFKVLSSNIPVRARSDKGQLLCLLCRLLDSYTERVHTKNEFDESELVKRIDGAVVYTSSNSKGGKPVRGISDIKRYDLLDKIYEYIKPIQYEYGEDNQLIEEYRVSKLIESLSSVTQEFGTGDRLDRFVGEFSKGIINENPSQIEDGIFEISKKIINGSATISTSINLFGSRRYLSVSLRDMTSLNEEEIESLSSVGSSLGGMFDTRENISILISLKHANSSEQFFSALEKAGMEGMKKSVVRHEAVKDYNLVRNDDLEQVIKTLSDAEKFEHAKNVLVSHASLSALYSNSKSTSENGD